MAQLPAIFSTSESRMKSVPHHLLAAAAAFGVALGASADAIAVDAAAAQQLARQSNCLKCHAVDRKKEGPSYKDVAAKYKGKPEARERITFHITSGEKVKFEDGHEEDHAIVKTKDKDKIDNLVDWILAQ
jgi:cytochrome c